MSIKCLALPLAGGWVLLPFAALAGGPPLLQRFHPAQVPQIDASAIAYVAPRFEPPHPAEGQIAYIDPVTQALLPAPAPGQSALMQSVVVPDPASRMRTGYTADGILYIETNGYHETMTATLDASGSLHFNCSTPGHDHTRVAPTKVGEQ